MTVDAPAPPAARPRSGARPTGAQADLAAGLLLAAAALALRLPTLLTVPRFTDEQFDVLYTMPLYRLQGFPLIGFDPYNGPLFSYLLAGLLWLVGPAPYVPRLLGTLLAAGTVVLTYLLGRSVAGRPAGLVAAGLLATCATHIVVNSHTAWSSAITPFFTTLALLLLGPAVGRGSGRHLALGAFALGLAWQTHPSVVALLPGVGLAVLLARRRLVFSRWGVVAALALLLAYSPVLAYALRPKGPDPYRQLARGVFAAVQDSPQETFERLSHEQEMNASGRAGLGLAAYPANLSALLLNLPRLAASLIEPRAEPTEHLAAPSFWLYAAVLAAGLVWPLRHRRPLLPLATLSAVALLPLVNGKYEPLYAGRYLMPYLPLLFVGFGGLLAELGDWRRAPAGLRAAWRPAAALVVALGLVAWPLQQLERYNRQAVPDGQINLDLIQSAGVVADSGRPGEPVLLDEALGRRGLPADGDLLQGIAVFLQLREVRYLVGPASAGKLDGSLEGARTALVVFAQPYDRALDARYRFTPLEERTNGRYAVYRVERKS